MDFNNFPNIQSHSFSSPSVRGLLLGKASEEYENGNHLNSIFYQVQSLSMGTRQKYLCNRFKGLFPTISNSKKHKTTGPHLNNQNGHHCFFKDYIDEKSTSPFMKYDFETKDECFRHDIDPQKGIEEILSDCSRFPKEWTIIQICKSFNPESSISLQSENALCTQPIYLTILRHPRSDSFPEPICIKLLSDDRLDSVMQQFYYLVSEMKERCAAEGDDRSERVKFWTQLDYLETDIKNALANLKDVIGPWAALLSGNISEDHEKSQKDLFDIVDSFSEKYCFNSTVIVLLSMLCRRISLLTDRDIQTASNYLAQLSENDRTEALFYDFLYDIKFKFKHQITYMPCILIIDEAMDHIFWEMLSPDQEICRISSLYMLKHIFQKYQKSISKGYIQLPIKNGISLVNPDKTLQKMEQRMHNFLSYWVPHWKSYCAETPSHEELIKCFQSCDTFIYCGHGSGLQYINAYKITELNINSVIFLFGCDSVRLSSDGLHSELTGSHIYYHAAFSPAIVGCSVIAFDTQLDMLSSEILSSWIPSTAAVHWSKLDKTGWKKGEINCEFAEEQSDTFVPPSYEPRLALILSRLRANEAQKTYNRILLIYRGLPVWNTCVTSL